MFGIVGETVKRLESPLDHITDQRSNFSPDQALKAEEVGHILWPHLIPVEDEIIANGDVSDDMRKSGRPAQLPHVCEDGFFFTRRYSWQLYGCRASALRLMARKSIMPIP